MERESQQEEFLKAFRTAVREHGGRFTAEREAVSLAMYRCPTHFSMEDLQQQLDEAMFRVVRATLYNTVNELLQYNLISRYSLWNKTIYEICFRRPSHSHQVCDRCGRITEFTGQELDQAIHSQKYRRFTLRTYSLWVFGTCSSCKAQIKRQEKKLKQNKQ